MKKSLIFSIALMFLAPAIGLADTVSTKSKISEVTVYAMDAFVTRVASSEVKPSDTRILLEDIVAEFDPDSLRVKGHGTAAVKILGAQVKKEFLQETSVEKVRELENRIQTLEDQNRAWQNEKQILTEEKAYLDSVRLFAGQQIPEDLVTKMPSPQDLEGTLSFLGSKLKENFSRVHAIDLEIRENGKKLVALRRELGEISGGRQKTRQIVTVDVEVSRAGHLDLEVSYKVSGASWSPVYDARAQFDKSETELVTYAIVSQGTGEVWEDVDMTLSTAQVSVGGTMPEVNSWFVHPFQPRQPLRGASMKLRAKSLGMADMAMRSGGEAEEPMLATNMALEAENLYAQASQKGVSVVYKLTRKVTVRPDGSDQKVPVTAQILSSSFEYSAYPRMVPLAYLTSRVTNAKDLQLLSGPVNIFLDGDFVGNSYVQNIAPGEEFDLYLGVDEGVKVKRELLEKKSDDVLIANIPSPNRKVTYKYKLTAENYKAQAGKLNLFETIPVSQDERIKVKVSQVSQDPQDKDWKDRKGVWRWQLQLAAGGKVEIFYTVVVEFPRDMTVEGLE